MESMPLAFTLYSFAQPWECNSSFAAKCPCCSPTHCGVVGLETIALAHLNLPWKGEQSIDSDAPVHAEQ
jgi:hypothetical protein